MLNTRSVARSICPRAFFRAAFRTASRTAFVPILLLLTLPSVAQSATYSGLIAGSCGDLSLSVSSPDPIAVSRSFSMAGTEPNSGCSGGASFRANGQSVGLQLGLDSDRLNAQKRASVTSSVPDFIIIGPTPTVFATFRFELSGYHYASGTTIPLLAGANGRSTVVATASVFGIPQQSLFLQVRESESTSIFDPSIPPPTYELLASGIMPTNRFFSIDLNLRADNDVSIATNGVSLSLFGSLGASSNARFSNTFGLAPTGDFITFDQSGYSLNSETAGILNSAWLPIPEPSSAMLLALGLSGLAFRRSTELR